MVLYQLLVPSLACGITGYMSQDRPKLEAEHVFPHLMSKWNATISSLLSLSFPLALVNMHTKETQYLKKNRINTEMVHIMYNIVNPSLTSMFKEDLRSAKSMPVLHFSSLLLSGVSV